MTSAILIDQEILRQGEISAKEKKELKERTARNEKR